MKKNIIIPVLHLFEILPKFKEEIQCFQTILRKSCKKKGIPLIIEVIPLIIKKEGKLYTEIDDLSYDTITTNYALLQTPKQELAEFFQSKGKAFCMKATIWKKGGKTKYALPDAYVKVD